MDIQCGAPIPDSPYLGKCPPAAPIAPVTHIGQIAASSTGTIPVGALSWSLTIIGANGTINTIAMGTGTTLTGGTLLDTAIALATGTTTTINYSYAK